MESSSRVPLLNESFGTVTMENASTGDATHHIDVTITRLSSYAAEWRTLSLQTKSDLLLQMMEAISDMELDGHLGWATATVEAQGLDADFHGIEVATEAMLQVALIKGHLKRLHSTFESFSKKGKAPPPLAVSERVTKFGEAGNEEGGRVQYVAAVFPNGPGDSNGRYGNFRGELWLKPGLPPTQGACLRKDGGVALVLGAGNRICLSIIDMLHVLFVHNEVVLMKHHALRNYQDEWVRAIFTPLIKRGFAATILDSTLEAAAHACYHPLVTHVHMTGGKATHDAIVWGGDREEQAQRKGAGEPKLRNATMTSELGAVTPWMVVPAVFSEAELKHQASHLARALSDNCSANYNAPKVVLLHRGWSQRKAFISLVKRFLRSLPRAVPYYPGTVERYAAFREAYPHSAEILEPFEEVERSPRSAMAKASSIPAQDLAFLAVYLDVGIDGSCNNDYAFKNEAFAPVVCFATVNDADGPLSADPTNERAAASFLAAAPAIVNDRLYGSLSATVILHPSTEAAFPAQCDRLVANLAYGTVCVNAWTALCYGLDSCSWGAFPGEALQGVQSGIGVVQNTLLFDHVQKTVVRAPLVDKGQLQHTPPPVNIILNVTKFLLRPGVGTFMAMAFPKCNLCKCCSYCLIFLLLVVAVLVLLFFENIIEVSIHKDSF